MKILVSDVWSVYNAGDRAILEGLLDGLRCLYPNASITVAAHFPDGCASLRGIRVLQDVLAFSADEYRAQMAHVAGTDARLDALASAYREADLVVSTGGYFLNATPGNAFTFVFLSRLLHFGWALDAGKPVAVLGQSLGPIDDPALQAAARATFARMRVVTARDAQSFSYVQRTGLAPHARFTADLAVDLAPASAGEVDAWMTRLDLPRGALGISVRDYPGTPANAFRDVARVADRTIRELGVPVLLIGTTIPPEDAPEVRRRERSLGNDDSIALLDVYSRMEEKANARVCVESVPPRLLKGILSTCRAFLGTRMHASILASTSGVPTAGIAYEYKVHGWFERMGLSELVVPLADADETHLWPIVERLIGDGPAIAAQLRRAIPLVQSKSRDNFVLLAELVAPTGSLPAPSATFREPQCASSARESSSARRSTTKPRASLRGPASSSAATASTCERSSSATSASTLAVDAAVSTQSTCAMGTAAAPSRMRVEPIDAVHASSVTARATAKIEGASLASASSTHGGPGASPRASTVLDRDDPRCAWESESHHYDVLHRRLQRIVALAEATGGRRLLDVGCSAGTIGAALSPRWTYHGCDVSESAVRAARRGWLVAADLEQGLPPFDGARYDAIVCSGVLEYLGDPAKVLEELVSRIERDGRLIVSYFNMRHVSRRGGHAFRHPLWRNDFAPAEFRELLARSGWTIEATHWSTAGEGSAPDVRDEAHAVRNEPKDAAARIDEIGHTLIYVCRASD